MKTSETYAFSTIYTGQGIVHRGFLKIIDGSIEELGEAPRNSIDLTDRIAVPGFIDIHTHGINGIDSFNLTKTELLEWSQLLLERGTLGFVPTIVSAPIEKIKGFLGVLKSSEGSENGAEIIGGRMEGPFISHVRKGAHDPSLLRVPANTNFQAILSQFKGILKIVDIAPELDGAGELISELVREDVVVSIGHTDCDSVTAKRAFALGATLVTHLYNAMRPFHHRFPGAIDFALLEKNVMAEIICDLVHVSPEAIKLAISNKGAKRIVLITDSTPATGRPDGKYKLGRLDVLKQGDKCTISGTETLAGSVLTMDRAVKNLVDLKYDLDEVVKMSSKNPATLLGRKDLGSIKKGKKANITILDKSLRVRGVVSRGALIEF